MRSSRRRSHETNLHVNDVRRLADVAYRIDDLAAAVSSGSIRTIGMIVAPCSMRSLGEIVHGITSNLLTRAADVCRSNAASWFWLRGKCSCMQFICATW